MLFAQLEEELQRLIRGRSPVRRFTDGAIIQQRGTAPEGFWVIEEGAAIAGQFTSDGAFRAMVVLEAGDSFGELAVFAQTPRVVDVVARGDARLRYVEAGMFQRLLQDYPVSSNRLLTALSLQLQEALSLLAGIRQGSGTARLAMLLANMAGHRSEPVAIDITQQELADLLGLTRATVNTALRSLEEAGLVTRRYGGLMCVRPDLLANIARG